MLTAQFKSGVAFFSAERICPALGALALAILLCGCGFHLRGEATLPFASLYISPGSSEFATLLKRAIRSGSETRVVDTVKTAQATLSILSERRERVILSLSAAGRVQELSLYYRVSFSVIDAAGKQYTKPNQIVLRRDLTYNDTDVISKEQEEVLLYKDMENDAVQQVMRRLAAARPVS